MLKFKTQKQASETQDKRISERNAQKNISILRAIKYGVAFVQQEAKEIK